MNKNTFLEDLMFMTREDIEKYIKEKGKPRKIIRPFVKIDLIEPEKDDSVNSRK